MNNSIKKTALLLALLLTFVPAAIGQEFIKRVLNHDDDHSIIREVEKDKWLVCDFNLGKTVFSMITDTGTYTEQLILGYLSGTDSTVVNDFEIFEDTVYFCGTAYSQGGGMSIWGYFPLLGFPNVQVYYNDNLGDYMQLNKLEVFKVDPEREELHIVMTGLYTYNDGILVEVVRTAPLQFTEYNSWLGWDDIIVDDVAVTDNYVVVSTRIINGWASQGRLFYFNKPTVTGSTIFASNTQYRDLIYTAGSTILLEHCTYDATAVVYIMTQSPYFYVGGFTPGPVYFSSTSIDHSHGPLLNYKIELRDIAYNKDTKTLDVLMARKLIVGFGYSSEVYHLPSAMASGSISSGFYHMIGGELNSLDYLNSDQDRYIASGRDISDQELHIYKYSEIMTYDCTSAGEYTDIMLKEEEPTWEIELNYDYLYVNMMELSSRDMEEPVRIKCE